MSASPYFSLLLATLLASPTTAQDQRRGVSGERAGTERWIVQLASRSFDLEELRAALTSGAEAAAIVAGLEAKVRADQKVFVEFVEQHEGRVTDQWWLVNGCAIEVTPRDLERVRAHPRVLRIQPDRHLPPAFIKTSTNAKNHRVDGLQSAGIKGKGATIAILDSGLDSDMAKSGRPHRSFFVNGDPNNKTGGGLSGSRLLANIKVGQQPADDILGHGTSVAAVAAGETWRRAPISDAGHAPLASLVGYSLSDLPTGLTLLTTMVRAWQRVAADKAKYGILVANMSYEGTHQPTSIEQQAMDNAARTADILVTVSAGNRLTSPAIWAHGATNVLAVGAVHADTRAVASFSRRGLLSDKVREYPNLVANGVQMVMPQSDNENTERVRSGTSYAAPQVAGAALLYRSLKSSATALETRAAILATTEDVAGKNRTAPYNSRQAYGFGYLRDDRLAALAQGKLPSLFATATLSVQNQLRQYKFPVTKGRYYAAALSWNRQDPTKNLWSNIDLAVMQGAFLFHSRNARNTNEKVVWRATASGVVDILVIGLSFEGPSQSVTLVVTEALPSFELGRSTRFGIGCPTFTTIVPELFGEDTVEIGRSYRIDLVRAEPNAVTLVTLGGSNTQLGVLPLPLDLGPFGAAGCSLRTSLESLLAGVTDGSGALRTVVAIPNTPALISLRVYHQALVRSPLTNSLGLVVSNGVEVKVGGDPN